MSNDHPLLNDFSFTPEMFSIQHFYPTIMTSEGPFRDWLASLTEDDFERTKIGHGHQECVELDSRSSWTCKKTVRIPFTGVINANLEFKLLKYEVGDFFKLHKDSHGTHTCLIFCPTYFKGGTLTLKKNDLCEIKIRPEVMRSVREGCFTMLTFSTDFLHEVSPITEGVRYVLKTTIEKEDDTEELENDDWQGGLDAAYDSGDY